MLWLSIWCGSHLVLVHLCLLCGCQVSVLQVPVAGLDLHQIQSLFVFFFFWKASRPQYFKSSLIASGDVFIFANFGCWFYYYDYFVHMWDLYYIDRHVNLCKYGSCVFSKSVPFLMGICRFFIIKLWYWSVHLHYILLHENLDAFRNVCEVETLKS